MVERPQGGSQNLPTATARPGYEQRQQVLMGSVSGVSEPQAVQTIPINVFHTTEGIEIVAPMPGLEPEDIELSIVGTHVTIHGHMRGLGQERKQYLLREWRYGPYVRSLDLPFPVNASQARVTFGNGVLTLTLPRDVNAKPSLAARPRTIHLKDTAFTGRFGSMRQDEGEPQIAGVREAGG